MMLFTLECIGVNNIRDHAWAQVGIFRSLSTVSDLTDEIMIPESDIMDGRYQNKVYRLPRLFFSPGPRSARLFLSLTDFRCGPAPLGSLFAGYFRLLYGLSVNMYLHYLDQLINLLHLCFILQGFQWHQCISL